MLNIVRIAFLVVILLYFLMSRSLPAHARPNPVLLYSISGLALADAFAIFVLRWILVLRSEQVLVANPADQKAGNRWRVGYLAMYAVALSIAIYGLLLHFLGFAERDVVPFFVAGSLFILILPPRPIAELR
jgi:hypothetical protein